MAHDQWWIIPAQVLTLFLGGGILLLVCLVVWRYWVDWQATPGRAGLLPLHVWMMAVSYALLTVTVMTAAFLNVVTWRAFIYVPALFLGLAGLFIMVHFQRRTYAHQRRSNARDEAGGS